VAQIIHDPSLNRMKKIHRYMFNPESENINNLAGNAFQRCALLDLGSWLMEVNILGYLEQEANI
jgi:hypothetical protein